MWLVTKTLLYKALVPILEIELPRARYNIPSVIIMIVDLLDVSVLINTALLFFEVRQDCSHSEGNSSIQANKLYNKKRRARPKHDSTFRQTDRKVLNVFSLCDFSSVSLTSVIVAIYAVRLMLV